MERVFTVSLIVNPFTSPAYAAVIIGVLLLALIWVSFVLIKSKRSDNKPPERDQSGERLKHIVNSAQIAYVSTVDGIITDVNKYCSENIGMNVGDDFSKYCDNTEQYKSILEMLDRQEKTSDAVFSFKLPGGQKRNFLVSCAKSSYEQNNIITMWGIDIESNKTQQELQTLFPSTPPIIPTDLTVDLTTDSTTDLTNETKQDKKNVNQAEGRLLIDISHEIRTPMNGIINVTDRLLSEGLDEQQERHVKEIRASVESLLGTINDLLDMNKINEGKLDLSPVDTDLNMLLKNVTTMMYFSAQSKGLNFIDDIRISSPEYIIADDVRLKQILKNLLSNAIKHTSDGHVKLTAKIEDKDIMFSISDTGSGIHEGKLPFIFNTDDYDDNDVKKNLMITGSGLSLPITKRLVELMNGKIWAESVYGSGSTFYVTIPYIPGDSSKIANVERVANHIFASTAEVLLVDDMQVNLTTAAGLLSLFGIAADVALSGREAIDLVKVKDYDIVFMDYMMPEMNGLEAMQAIRCMGEKYVRLPVIAMTANGMTDARELLLASGMNDFLPKPIDKELVMEILQKWLPPEKVIVGVKQAAKPTSYSKVLSAASNIEGLDINLALSRISYMHDVLEESIKLLAYALGERLARMDSLLSTGDMRGFTIEIHGLKGSFANIGATRNSELATELELAARADNIMLCKQKFEVFAEVIAKFTEQLKSIFPKAVASDKRQGDNELLRLKTLEIIDFLNRFEAKEALKLLDEIEVYTFGETADNALSEARRLVEIFKYKNAIALLMGILKELN